MGRGGGGLDQSSDGGDEEEWVDLGYFGGGFSEIWLFV